QRIAKIVKPKNGGVLKNQNDWITTVYSLDGSGSAMGIYELSYEELMVNQTVNEKIKLKELNLYAASRLGNLHEDILMASKEYNIMGYDGNGYFVNKTVTPSSLYTLVVPSMPFVNTLTKGKKQYELSNHLGNVLATISDRRIGIDNNADLVIDYYNPDVLSTTD